MNLKVLTGTEGSISSKSLTSLELTLWALKRLDKSHKFMITRAPTC